MRCLIETRNKVRAREAYFQLIVRDIDLLLAQRPTALFRVIFEKALFSTKFDEDYLFGEEPFGEFMKKQVVQVHPIVKPFLEDAAWEDFFSKYLIMSKETLNVCQRNLGRQRRGGQRYMNDMKIMISEANFTDGSLLMQRGLQYQKHNTVAMHLAINMTVQNMLRQLHQTFTLELVRLEELPYMLMYLGYLYQFIRANHEPIAAHLVEDLSKQGIVNFQDIYEAGDKFR